MSKSVLFERKQHPYEIGGHTFGIRELDARSASVLARMLMDAQKGDGPSFYDVQVEYVRRCLVDEGGNRVFADDDDSVYEMNNIVLTDIAERAMAINRKSVEEAEKN